MYTENQNGYYKRVFCKVKDVVKDEELIVKDGVPRIANEEEILEELYYRIDYLDHKISRLPSIHEELFDITQDDVRF